MSNRPTTTQLADGRANGESGADSSARHVVRPGDSSQGTPAAVVHSPMNGWQ